MPTTDLAATALIDGQTYDVDTELNAFLADGLTRKVPAASMPPVVCGHTKQVIKHEDWFLVADQDGNAYPDCTCGHGLYSRDTRYLSGLTLGLAGVPLALLASTAEDNFTSAITYTNGEFTTADGRTVRREHLLLSVTRLADSGLRQRVHVANYNPFPLTLELSLEARSDFKDVFEVRGFPNRERPGTFMKPKVSGQDLILTYVGADGEARQAAIAFSPVPTSLTPATGLTGATGGEATFRLELAPNGGEATVEVGVRPRVHPAAGDVQEKRPDLATHLAKVAAAQGAHLGGHLQVSSSHPVFEAFIDRGIRDICTLTNTYATGPLPVAGIPWFTCPFGRDSLITAYQALSLSPVLAVGTLRYMAAHQGTKLDPTNDEQPGKILHEHRDGELSRAGWVPFAPYYGTIDATPLFLVLLSETYRWTGDVAFVRELWPHALRALEWMDAHGDLDGDGFLEYASNHEKGLHNQGWKDSHDSVIHSDWQLAVGPTALAEVQGYAYDAKRRMAELARVLAKGNRDDEAIALADRLDAQAARLKARFREAFLTPDGYYAIALDGQKAQVRSHTSNPGHCLWSGLIDGEDAARVSAQMVAPDMFNGFGIRTMSKAMTTYNPISYHNGTVWPHDCSLIAKGMADRGHPEAAGQVLTGLFDAARHFPYTRLPELFCGFDRAAQFTRPLPYPTSCSPQAWAAGTPLLLLQAVLGLQPDARHGTLRVRPVLPAWLPDVTLRGLKVGDASVDLRFARGLTRTTCEVLEVRGADLRVVVEA